MQGLSRLVLAFCGFNFFLSVADKGIQHVSPFSFPWPLGSGFPSAFLTELKNSMNHHNHAAVSSERQRIMRWDIDDVANHVRLIGCTDQAKIFSEQVCVISVDCKLLFPRCTTLSKFFAFRFCSICTPVRSNVLYRNRSKSSMKRTIRSQWFFNSRLRLSHLYAVRKHSNNQFALNIRKLWKRVTLFDPYGFLSTLNCTFHLSF